MYAQIKDGEIINIGELPEAGTLSDGRIVVGYAFLDESILKSEGWYPCEKNEPEYDAATQTLIFDSHDFTLVDDVVTIQYKVISTEVPESVGEIYE